MITIPPGSDVQAVLEATTYPLTHLIHVKLEEDGLQHGGVSLDHIELKSRACSTIANDERDSAKDQLVPRPRESLPGQIICCSSKAAPHWLVFTLEKQGTAIPTAEVRPLGPDSG